MSEIKSKYSKYASDAQIYPHKHCSVCNKLINIDQNVCSEECGMATKKKDKKSKKRIFSWIFAYVAAIVVLFVVLGNFGS